MSQYLCLSSSSTCPSSFQCCFALYIVTNDPNWLRWSRFHPCFQSLPHRSSHYKTQNRWWSIAFFLVNILSSFLRGRPRTTGFRRPIKPPRSATRNSFILTSLFVQKASVPEGILSPGSICAPAFPGRHNAKNTFRRGRCFLLCSSSNK